MREALKKDMRILGGWLLCKLAKYHHVPRIHAGEKVSHYYTRCKYCGKSHLTLKREAHNWVAPEPGRPIRAMLGNSKEFEQLKVEFIEGETLWVRNGDDQKRWSTCYMLHPDQIREWHYIDEEEELSASTPI